MKLLICLSASAVRLLVSVVCVSGLAFSNGVLARTCTITATEGSFNSPVIVPVAGAGLATIGEDTPVGTVLYTSRVTNILGATRAEFACNATIPGFSTIQRTLEATLMPSGTPVSSGGLSIYPTNIPGIGVTFRLYSFGNPVTTMFPDIFNLSTIIGTDDQGNGNMLSISAVTYVEFDLIKTGMIEVSSTQQVLGTSFPVFQISTSISPADNVSEQILNTINFTGAVTFHTKTCQIAVPGISVDLGLHPVSDFRAPGTTTEWKSFDIILQNCPPFYGYGMNNQLSVSTGSELILSAGQTNKVGFTFNSANGVVENHPMLAKIESGPDAAEGIGIEMQQLNGGIILLDGSGGFELDNLTTEDGGTYVVPLQARYFQYDSDVKAGPANGAVVFTITYQ